MSSKFTTKKMAMIGLFAALVFVSSFLSFPIPTPLGNTRLHLGNVFCLLSGFILGPLPGGLAAGIGSMFFDFANPLYVSSAPFTLVFKFFMAFICGSIAYAGGAKGLSTKRNVVAGAVGALSYVVLYLGKSFLEMVYFNRAEVQTAIIDILAKGVVSGTNAVIAVIAAVPLALAIRKSIKNI